MSKSPSTTPSVNSAIIADLPRRDVRTLVHHRILSLIQMLSAAEDAENASEYEAGLLSVREHGVHDPLGLIEGTNIIWDGRHRSAWTLAAGDFHQEEERYFAPVFYVSEEEAMRRLQDNLFARRSLKQGQRAWAWVAINAALLQEGSGRSLELRSGCAIDEETAAKYAGVSRRTLQSAKSLHKFLGKDPRFTKGGKKAPAEEARKAVEARIWAGDDLQAILSDLKPAPNDAKQQQDTPEVDPNLDIKATEAVNRFSQLLLDWETEIITGESHRLLPAPALLETTRRTAAVTTALLEGLIGCPDIMDTHKAQILSDLQATLTAARESLAGK